MVAMYLRAAIRYTLGGHIFAPSSMRVPAHYVPASLSPADRRKQLRSLKRSRRAYKAGRYVGRPKLASARTRKSKHMSRLRKTYKLGPGRLSYPTLARKSGCTRKAIKRILKKGRGAFYSSGSRPNQTAESWAVARLASALTGGPAAKVDMHIMEEECGDNSKALALARQVGGARRMRERIVSIEKSQAKGKKYKATVKDPTTGRTRTIQFGGLGYAQYKDRTPVGAFSKLDHGDRARMGRYFLRHSGTRNRERAIAKEKRLSGYRYTPKILSHEYLW